MSSVLINIPNYGEMDLECLCEMQYKRIIALLGLLEETFGVDIRDYPDIRKNILDTGNFIRRLPLNLSEVVPNYEVIK